MFIILRLNLVANTIYPSYSIACISSTETSPIIIESQSSGSSRPPIGQADLVTCPLCSGMAINGVVNPCFFSKFKSPISLCIDLGFKLI